MFKGSLKAATPLPLAVGCHHSWHRPDEEGRLSAADVHVWEWCLDLAAPLLSRLWATLSPDERERARRFHFSQDRDRFIAAHGTMRVVLARYVGSSPADLAFQYNEHGKPALPAVFHDGLHFNLAHSHSLAVLALAHHRQIGVDVEQVREVNYLELAEHFFESGEVAALRALPVQMLQRAFFACWTRKEAYLKARGDGLSMALNDFQVSLLPGHPPAVLKSNRESGAGWRWSMRELALVPGYVGTVCVEGQRYCLQIRHTQMELIDERMQGKAHGMSTSEA